MAALDDSVSIGRRHHLGGLASYYDILEAQQLFYPAEISLSETSRDSRFAVALPRQSIAAITVEFA